MSLNRLVITGITALAVACSLLQVSPLAQGPEQSVTTFQYRHVAAEHVPEFLFRETTYWSKVAQKAVEAKKMTFWALLEQVGGHNLQSSPNYLFINTFPDIDAVGDVFAPGDMFPGVPMASIDTNALSTTTDMFFLHTEELTAAAGVVPGRDFKYVTINYHSSSDAGAFIDLERQIWMPFIKAAMDSKQTAQLGWTSGYLIAPVSQAIGFNTVSFDMFPSLQKALMPGWAADAVFPTAGLEKLNTIRTAPMQTAVYRIVHVVSAE